MIAADGMSADAEKSMLAFFKEHGLGWWHRIPNFWLITDPRGNMTATVLRDKIQDLRSPGAKATLVMQIHEDITWAGLYPDGDSKHDEFDWLNQTWTKD